MLIRLILVCALGLTMVLGLLRMLNHPAPEKVENALPPAKEVVAETQAKTTEVLLWISDQTPESIGALVRDAKEDVARSLMEDGPGADSQLGQGARQRGLQAPSGGRKAGDREGQQPPGIEWYRE